MRFAVYGRNIDNSNRSGIRLVFEHLAYRKDQVFVHESYRELLEKNNIAFPPEAHFFNGVGDINPLPDFFISLGGDGTLLGALPFLYPYSVPVIAVNVGRLGYLTTTEVAGFEKLLRTLDMGQFVCEDRTLVEAFVSGQRVDSFGMGLNEITVVKTDTSAMINIETYIDGHFFSDIWADGLVVSTPTGSTAYSLSCGGPVITPVCPVLVMSPIAPHNLNVRPIVFSDDSTVRLIIHSRSNRFICSLDSRFVYLPVGTEIEIRKSAWTLKLVRESPGQHLETLRNKLLWGSDMRNRWKFHGKGPPASLE
ncbi:MAG: NAD kinase [Flavobacteriales bacterium]|nr:NAD kinase [Flavobacteriales bacterium]